MTVSILVPWRSSPERVVPWAYVRQQLPADVEVVIGESPDGPFNRSAAINDAAKRATGDVFVIHDADSLVHPWALAEAIALAEGRGGLVFPYDRYKLLNAETTDALLTWGLKGPFIPAYETGGSLSGVVVAHRETFQWVEGFDERFVGWGFEDVAFGSAVRALVGPDRRVEMSELWSLWHTRPDDGSVTYEANHALCVRYTAADQDGVRALIEERSHV